MARSAGRESVNQTCGGFNAPGLAALAPAGAAAEEGDREGAVNILYKAVLPMTETGYNGSLWDWLYEGDYDGDERVGDIAAEWDGYQ